MITDARNLWELVEMRAALTPDAPLMFDEDRVTNCAQLRMRAEEAAVGLHALGVREGTAVSWQLPTWTEAAVLVLALARLGAVQNPMLPSYREREVGFIAKQTNCELLIVPTEFRSFDHVGMAKSVARSVDGLQILVVDRDLPTGDPSTLPPPPPGRLHPADDPVRWIFYTSGTTADPKGAQHTDRTIMATGIGYCDRVRATDADISLVAFPFTHIGGIIIGIYQSLLTGAGAVMMETWTPQLSTELIARHGITFPNGAPAIHALLLEEARGFPEAYATVRAFPSGGAQKPPQLHEDLKHINDHCVGIVSGYGLTEMPILAQSGIDDPDDSLRDAEGRPMPGVEVRIVDHNLDDVPPGGVGELVARGPQLMRGYVDASLNEAAFITGGWLRTGDLARLDAHGAVIITGRLKDVIIRKGENISAKEVEDLLFGHPDIADVAVLGLPDPDLGERCCAVIVVREGAAPPTLPDVFEFLKATGLMVQKIPEQVELVDAIPRNPSGKVLKNALRERFGD